MPRRPSQLSAVGYQLVLAASAIGRTFALQAVFGLALHRVPLAVVAFMLLAGSSLAFGLMQRLWTVPQLRSLLQLLRIGANGAALVASLWLSLYGLRHLGTFLTVIAEMSEMLVAAAPSVLAADVGVSRQQTNGLLLMSLGYAALLVPVRGDAGSQSRGLALAAHFAAAALTFARERTPHRLAGSVGGPKRLNALVHACALALCAPVALWAALSERREGGEVEGVAAAAHGGQASPASGGWVSASAEAAALALVLLVLPFYARALAQAQLPGGNPARVVAPSAACAALTIDLMLGPRISLASPLVSTGALLVLGGVVLLRTQPAGAELAGLLGGASAARGSGGIPLLARAARAARAGCVQADALRAQVWARKSTRKLLLFLVVQAAFTLVEAALGRASSSLSLVSDACHMLLDCSGLALGLFGEVSARWQPSPAFTYGHSRQEVLCTFANASLLLLTAATLTRQAVSRLLWGGALIETERLLPVAVIGLCVNLLGVCLFSEHHRHLSAQPCAGCDADGAQGTSANMAAVLVHIAADALGSLGVIVSSLLIRYLGWTLADPLCSLLISALIALSSWPLLAQSAQVLLQRTPYMLDGGRREACLAELSQVHGVEEITAHAFWMLTSRYNVGTLHIRLSPGASARQVLPRVRQVVRAYGIDSVTVEVEAEAHEQALPHDPGVREKDDPVAVLRTPSATTGAASRSANGCSAQSGQHANGAANGAHRNGCADVGATPEADRVLRTPSRESSLLKSN